MKYNLTKSWIVVAKYTTCMVLFFCISELMPQLCNYQSNELVCLISSKEKTGMRCPPLIDD